MFCALSKYSIGIVFLFFSELDSNFGRNCLGKMNEILSEDLPSLQTNIYILDFIV